MRKRDISLILVMLAGALIVAILPQSIKVDKEIHPYNLIDQATHQAKYMTADVLAKLMMNNDPSIILVDVRSADEFAKFSLTSAQNTPLENILDKKVLSLFNQKAYTFVLYSNGSITSSKAWLLLRRIGYKNIKVLEGGLNQWVETILQPKELTFMAKPDEVAQYEFRKAASRYFGRASTGEGEAASQSAPPAPSTPVITRKKKAASGGGCD